MFLCQCNHPGCNEHAPFKSPNVKWNCGRHDLPIFNKPERGHLPARHPQKSKYKYGSKERKK